MDEETGLYYFGARYYDPRASLWVSVDPILGEYLPYEGKEDPMREMQGAGQGTQSQSTENTHQHVNQSWSKSYHQAMGEKDAPAQGLRDRIYQSNTMNLFAYVSQRPINFIDPDGRVDLAVFVAEDLTNYTNSSTPDVGIKLAKNLTNGTVMKKFEPLHVEVQNKIEARLTIFPLTEKTISTLAAPILTSQKEELRNADLEKRDFKFDNISWKPGPIPLLQLTITF